MNLRHFVMILLLLALIGSVFAGACKKTGTSQPTPTASPTASAPVSPTPNPALGAVYSNTTYGFSIEYPEGWIEEETGEKAPAVQIHSPVGFPLVVVLIDSLAEDMTAAGYEAAVKEEMSRGATLDEAVERDITLSDGTKALELSFTTTFGASKTKGKMAFVSRGSQMFVVQMISTPTDFEQRKDILDAIISSFHLEEPKPFGIARSQSLTVWDLDPVTLDPATARGGESVKYIVEVFSGLVSFDKDMKLAPDIARDWDVKDGGKTYVFHIRRGVKFHSGREVTADDFKYSMERAADPNTKSQTAETYLGDIVGVKEKLAGEAAEISGVKVLDKYKLQINIDAPKVYFLAKLAYPTAFVVDGANVASGAEWWRTPNGTGPFKVKEWQKDQILILERNSDYYLDPAKVQHVVVRILGGVPMIMYENGEIDFADAGVDVERVRDPANPLNQELFTTPGLALAYVGFNSSKPPFDDARVRQAFVQAIDKDKINDLVLKQTVDRADVVVPPGMPGYDNSDVRGLPFDAARAKALIAESKYGDVSKLPPITITTAGTGQVSPLETALVDMWRQNLGVEVQARQLRPEDYNYVIKREKNEMFFSAWGADYPDPQNFLDVLFHSGTEDNIGDYSNQALDALLELARVEQDAAARMKLYRQAEQIVVDDAAILPLYFDVSYTLIKPYVKNLPLTPLSIPRLRYVSLEPQ